jgi:hypothetical protein
MAQDGKHTHKRTWRDVAEELDSEHDSVEVSALAGRLRNYC